MTREPFHVRHPIQSTKQPAAVTKKSWMTSRRVIKTVKNVSKRYFKTPNAKTDLLRSLP
jgi:hypothetical protein